MSDNDFGADLKPGDIFSPTGSKQVWRFERFGCATGWDKCPNKHPITATPLKPNGKAAPGGTRCLDMSQVETLEDTP